MPCSDDEMDRHTILPVELDNVCLDRFYKINLNEMLDDLFPGCDHSGVTYKNSDIFSPTGDPCDMCTCQVIIMCRFQSEHLLKVHRCRIAYRLSFF